LNGGRESILQLKGELAGRVLRQVRAFEQRSNENIQNRSFAPSIHSDKTPLSASTFFSNVQTPEQNLLEQALKQCKKLSSASSHTGEITRSIKRLQNTPQRRWKERVREYERRHQLTPPYRLLNRKRK